MSDAPSDAYPEPEDLSAFDGALNSIDPFVSQLQRQYPERIVAHLSLPAEAGRYVDLPADLDPALAMALKIRGVSRLYSHQRETWEAVAAGQHPVIVTPTASGKTLCYNLPVLQAARQRRAKALYLFPTKALAQDQVAEVMELNTAGDLGVRTSTFDGDTPSDARRMVRSHADIVVTNPDMLHQGILPHHTKWAPFFENLAFVVIDELHTYRGVFGSHMANLLRRLRRILRFYRVEPQFILCSATIANPAELAEGLLEVPVHPITISGAPRGRRELLLWNPPLLNAELNLRQSNRAEVTTIAQQAVTEGLKTIVFAPTRQAVEVMTKYLKDTLERSPDGAGRVRSYRGGYLPTNRRTTERELRAGEVDCVVTTSALELGVDIGSLDVCVLAGYPGTIAGTWQRLGRAGRRRRPALGILVASSLPLDQYLMQHPDFFLGGSPEQARIDPEQLLILYDHLRCAAFELPFWDGETFGRQPLDDLLGYLAEEGMLHHERGRWHWMSDDYPANSVNLRRVAEGNFVVVDVGNPGQRVIAEVDYASAATTLHQGAIYLIRAETWQIEELDWVGRKAYARRARADYYTTAIDYSRLKVLDAFEQDSSSARVAAHGEVHLVRRVAGYKKTRFYSHENVGYGNVNLPDQEMHTTAVWWQLATEALDAAFGDRWQALDGFLGAAHALHVVATLRAMCEPHDLGKAVGNDDDWFAVVNRHGRGEIKTLGGDDADIYDRPFQPTVFLYDNYPGGIGLSAALFDLRQTLVTEAADLIQQCPCQLGCPACIGPIFAEDDGLPPKQTALRVLAMTGQQT